MNIWFCLISFNIKKKNFIKITKCEFYKINKIEIELIELISPYSFSINNLTISKQSSLIAIKRGELKKN